MQLAVVTIAIGQNSEKIKFYTLPTIENYAKKVNAELVVIDEVKISTTFPHFEKFQLYDLLEKYDRIIYLDIDIIVKQNCPNLFEIVPEEKIGLFNEATYLEWNQVLVDASQKFNLKYSKYEGRYYNSGVMVVSKIHKDIFVKPQKEYSEYVAHFAFDQPYINLKLFNSSHNKNVHELSYQYNRMEYIDKLTGDHRFNSYIIHYAGVGNRERVIVNDLEEMEKDPEKKYPTNILFIASGGLGDQIAVEPILRYTKEKLYPGANIKAISDWPIIYKHLNILTCKRPEFKMDNGYFIMDAVPGEKAPIWQFLSQAICHTTDFASIACLRTIIPDEFKQIKLPVLELSLGKFNRLLKGVDISRSILIHPGKGWPSKTFPKDWWDAVVTNLSKSTDRTCIIIGKQVNDDQGYVDVDVPENVYDLRDLLELEDLIALISKACCVITNDSVPVHIAGAFDTNIVLIPTCKHPDHVLPYRHKGKYYKAIAIYKKLTCDFLNHKPTNYDGETIDRVIGDIRDYLPETNEVVEKTLELIGDRIS